MSRFVLDASVVLNWCFPDEDSAVAHHVAHRFKQGDAALASSFWPHEVLNALLAGEKRKRISREVIQSFLGDLALLPVTLEPCPAGIVFDRVQSLSRRHQLTPYDAAYLDLAIENGLALATLDEALVRACQNAGVGLVQP
ncbi:MAG: type II toxin-antitoxin system VapC family toxin [Terriglobales bacterium]